MKPSKYPEFPQNLRPISRLSTMGKLFENLFLSIQKHAEERNLLKASEFGFQTYQSTTVQCTRLVDHATLNFNNNGLMAGYQESICHNMAYYTNCQN
jgi:DNA polymerase sigma